MENSAVWDDPRMNSAAATVTATTVTTTDRFVNEASIPGVTTATGSLCVGRVVEDEEDAIVSSVCPCQLLVVTKPIDRVIAGGCVDH